jgi:rhamnogalacturonyl hydrolase YesR
MRIHPKKLFPLTTAALALAFALPSTGFSATAPKADHATFTEDGAWCWFSNPRAIYRKGNIYAGWITSDGSVEIGRLDAATGAKQIATLAPKFEADDHNNPALLFLPDGRLAVFYSLHAKGDMRMRVTKHADSILDWTPERSLGFEGAGTQGVTYSNPVLLSEEQNAIYLFWRGSDFKPTFSVSKDLGKTWSPPRTLLRGAAAGADNRPYLKVSSDGRKRIDFAFTDGHPRNEAANSLYFLRYEDGVFSKADGTRIGGMDDLPLNPAKCERVYDGSTAGRAWIWDIAGRQNQVAIAYTRLPRETDHRYHYLRWDGKQWHDSQVAEAGKWFPQTPPGKTEREPHYSAGIALDHHYLDTVYLSRPVEGVWEIERWRTPDKGASWRHEPVTSGSRAGNVRPFVVRNAPRGEPYLMWMNLSGRYVHYTDYRTSLQINLPATVAEHAPLSPALEPAAVLAAMRRVGDWDLAHDWRIRPDDWVVTVGYTGLMALADTSGDAKYRDALRAVGEANDWKLGPTKYFADDHCIGQTYAELFLRERDPRMIAPMRAHFDSILAAPKDDDLRINSKGAFDKWSWCDSLFMAPPAWLRLWKATDDTRYLDFAVENWWKTSDYLYDKEEHLYFRDSAYFTKREANGQKVFWSRGNGWVMGGLVRMLQFLPKDHPSRPRFEEQFRQMSAKLLSLQQRDGMWRSSLLDPKSYPLKETSGTGLITYGLAWGVNNGLLDRARYAPAVTKAWQALVSCVQPDGRLTHVQPVGADPQRFDPRSTDAFGVGAFLLAGSEAHRLGQKSK